MKTSYLLLLCSLSLALTSFINGHSDIKSASDLLNIQYTAELLGVVASVAMTWIGKSPLQGQMKPHCDDPTA